MGLHLARECKIQGLDDWHHVIMSHVVVADVVSLCYVILAGMYASQIWATPYLHREMRWKQKEQKKNYAGSEINPHIN
eukprot:426803-Pelagomonas_calceolata.AAC.2